jgi:hypothetical protein
VLTPDKLTLNLIFRDYNTTGGNFGVGVRVGTGETGKNKVYTYPYIQRTSCTNSIVWKEEGAWDHAHTGEGRVLKVSFLASLIEALAGSENLLEKFLEAEIKKLKSFDQILDEMTERHNWTKEVHDNILKGTEGNETVGGMVNGLSFAAQRVENPDESENLEELAGEFLYNMTKKTAPVTVPVTN